VKLLGKMIVGIKTIGWRDQKPGDQDGQSDMPFLWATDGELNSGGGGTIGVSKAQLILTVRLSGRLPMDLTRVTGRQAMTIINTEATELN